MFAPERYQLLAQRTVPVEQDTLETIDGWRHRAACRSVDPDLFFAPREDLETIAKAKAICAGCDVREECLLYALETKQSDGVWGGHTPAERSSLRRRWMRQVREAS